MIALDPFAAGLGVIALQLNAGLTEAHVDAYHAALEAETDAAEWEAFSRVAAKRAGWRLYTIPTVPELLDALREFRGGPSLDTEAIVAYERVQACGEYTAEGGTSWTYRRVLETCGRAAAEAFLAAGGSSAWATSWKETDRRERFVAVYTTVARQEPALRLLPPSSEEPRGQLTDGHEADPQPSQDEARAALERVRGMVAIPEPEPVPRMTKAQVEARLEELRRQAEQIAPKGAEEA